MVEDTEQLQETAKRTCFVVCPIGPEGSTTRRHADWLLHEIIEYVLDRYFPDQFLVTRSDKIVEPGMIDAQIIGHLLEDDLVIADMSELNPNAFYEMGIRHMQQRPIIHMFKKGETIPFDVKLYRAIPFDYGDPVDLKAARSDLRNAIAAVIDPGYKPDNPIIRARGFLKVPESSAPASDLVQHQLDELYARVSRLDGNAPRLPERGAGLLGPGSITIKFDKRYSHQDRAETTKLLTTLAAKYFEGCTVRGDHTGVTVELGTSASQEMVDEFTDLAYRVGIVKDVTIPPTVTVLSS